MKTRRVVPNNKKSGEKIRPVGGGIAKINEGRAGYVPGRWVGLPAVHIDLV